MAESEELKSLLMKVREESGKASIKLNIQKTKIMASGPIISWHINGETMETVKDLIFLGSKITWKVTASMKSEHPWFLEEKIWQSRQHVKSRAITLPTQVHLVRAMVFPVVTYGCESWTIKKAECRRIDAFKLWCWEDSWESFGQQDQTSQS